MSASVEERFKRLMKKYEIPEQQAFNVKTLLELQKEYEDMPKDKNTLKNRQTLIQTISYVQGNIGKLKKKFEHGYDPRSPYVLLIVVENVNKMNSLKSILDDLLHTGLINMQNVLRHDENERMLRLEFGTGLLVKLVVNDENLRGIRCHSCINITNEDIKEKVFVVRKNTNCKWG